MNYLADAMRVDFKTGTFYLGDCFEVMATLDAGSVDMVLNDPPYGTTQNKWDAVIPFEPMWAAYWRLLKSNGAAVLTATQPFSSVLTVGQLGHFKYEWIWKKSKVTGVLNAKLQPLRQHESALVFCRGKTPYNAQGVIDCNKRAGTGRAAGKTASSTNYGAITPTADGSYQQTQTNWPRSVLEIPSAGATIHPTQKPVALFEYLIRTYTMPGELVLDNTAGSGTTAIAAMQSGRRWICIERDEDYFAKAIARVWDAEAAL